MPTITVKLDDGEVGGTGTKRLTFRPRQPFIDGDTIVTPDRFSKVVTRNTAATVTLRPGPWQVSGINNQTPIPFDVGADDANLKDLIYLTISGVVPSTATLTEIVNAWLAEHGGGGGGGATSNATVAGYVSNAGATRTAVDGRVTTVGDARYATTTQGAKADSAVQPAALGGQTIPEQFGAVGDGTTNDTTAMQSWLTDVVTNKRHGVLTAGKTYRIASALTIAVTGAKDWSVDGRNATLLQATDGASIIAFTRENIHDFRFDNVVCDWVNDQTSAMGTIGVTFDDGANTALGYGWYGAYFANWRFTGKAYRGFQSLENSHTNPLWNTEFRGIRGDYGMAGSLIRLHCSIGQANVCFPGCYQHRGTSTEPCIDAQLLTGFSIDGFESNNEGSTAKDSLLLSYCFGGTISFRSERGSLGDGDAVANLIACAGVTVTAYQVSAIEAFGGTNNAIFDISATTTGFAVIAGVIDTYGSYPTPPATLAVVKADSTSVVTALETTRAGSAVLANPASKLPQVGTARIADAAVTPAKISATGTASATTFLRGDGAWASAGSKRALESTMVRSDQRVYGDITSYTADSTAPTGQTEFPIASNAAKFLVNCPLIDLGGLSMPQYNGSTKSTGTSPAGFVVEVIHSGTAFTWKLGYGTSHQVYIDDQPCTPAPVANNSGGYTYVKLVFPSARARRIRIECVTGTTIDGAYSNAANTFYAAPARKFRAAIIGDSWVQQGMCEHLAMVTGWDVYNMGQGSTGYVADGGGAAGSLGHTPYGSTQRMNALAALPALDLIIAFGSVNDTPYTAGDVVTAAQSMWSAVQSARPSTPLIVVGHEPARGGAAADAINSALKTAAASAGLPFVDWRSASTLTGTGKITAKAGDGTCDFYMSDDNLHPTSEGFLFLAREMSTLLGPIQV